MNATPTLLFAHGWAFDSTVWDALRERLADWPQAVLDAAYFEDAPAASGALQGPVLAIGHSYGVMRLLEQLPAGCAGMVSMNGFSRFCAGPDFPAGTPAKLVDRMIARLQQAPLAVLNAFRERCGAGAIEPAILSPALIDDLLALRHDDRRASLAELSVPVLALAGTDDLIVPPALTRAVFDGRPGAELHWHEGGGHLLPQSAPDWCAARIRSFLESLSTAS
jgi:pimeloyl-[acyl-carrier protein] methyl ester esterase